MPAKTSHLSATEVPSTMAARTEAAGAAGSRPPAEPQPGPPQAPVQARGYCAVKPRILRPLPSPASDERQRAIIRGQTKWLNGTQLHYYFFGSSPSDGSASSWAVPENQRAAIRQAFSTWKALGVGLVFTEVTTIDAAEIRIAYDQSDGSWSYVGRDILDPPKNDRTMNFGWDLTDAYGATTALHEIGHTLGMPHEHQNPYAGIVWNEQAVYDFLAAPPNNWSHETTFNNVLKKLSTAEVTGSQWDWKSVMEYDFPAGLIIQPADFAGGVHPPGGLSDLDKQFMLSWYPSMGGPDDLAVLEPFASVAAQLSPGQQIDYLIKPATTRTYTIGTFGASDTVIGLFEKAGTELTFVNGDDDSGDDSNAQLRLELQSGREYVVRLRCYYSGQSATTALMYW